MSGIITGFLNNVENNYSHYKNEARLLDEIRRHIAINKEDSRFCMASDYPCIYGDWNYKTCRLTYQNLTKDGENFLRCDFCKEILGEEINA